MKAKYLKKVLNENYSYSIDINGVSVSTQWGLYHNYNLPQDSYRLVLLAITRNANNRIINVKHVESLTNGVKQDPKSVKTVFNGLTSFKAKHFYMSQYLFIDNQLSI